MTTAENNPTQTTIFNLIILDESGSMSCIKKQTISGCNELINTIKTTQESSGHNVRSLVSIYAFQGDGNKPSRYIIKNADPASVKHITEQDYTPWGSTPLLDAVGSTLSELKTVSETHEDATGTITIMTDGYENSSKLYTWEKVATLISWFKEMGWTVNLIGANVDVVRMASQMNINASNAVAYEQSAEGSKEMWTRFHNASRRIIEDEACCCEMAPEERLKARKSRSASFFKEK